MKKEAKVLIFFFTAGLLVFGNSLNNAFMIDDYIFLGNPVTSQSKFALAQWDPYLEQSLGVVDMRGSWGYYRPTTHMVYDFCYAVFKNSYWLYHLFNLGAFVLAAALIYLFVERMAGNFIIAFLAGFFYLIHPINGIVVDYISAGVFALQVIFTLGSILLLGLALERNNDRTLYFLSLLFLFLSLFWNESGIMTPFYIAAFILPLGKGPLKQKIYCLFPYFLIVLSYLVFRLFFVSIHETAVGRIALLHMSVAQQAASLFHVLMWYISRLFYPQGIVMAWTTPLMRDHILMGGLGLCLLLTLFLLFYIKFTGKKILQMAVLWVFIGFVPVWLAAFIKPESGGAQIEPHWFVVSSIGFFILTAYFCAGLLERAQKAGVLVLFILTFAWGAVSHANNRLWADQKTYALYCIEQVPNPKIPYLYLADAYLLQGAFKEAKKYYRAALTGYPTDLKIYNNLGTIEQKEGNWKGAEHIYRGILQIDPQNVAAYNNLGTVFFHEGQWDKARENYALAVMFNPLLMEPRRNLAAVFLKKGEYQKAIDLCVKNIDIVPNDPETLFLLIDIYLQKKDLVSVQKYAYLIIHSQKDPKVLLRLADLMDKNKAYIIALDSLSQAIRVAPEDREAYLGLGALMAHLGSYDKAIDIWKIGSSLNASDRRFQIYINKVMSLRR